MWSDGASTRSRAVVALFVCDVTSGPLAAAVDRSSDELEIRKFSSPVPLLSDSVKVEGRPEVASPRRWTTVDGSWIPLRLKRRKRVSDVWLKCS